MSATTATFAPQKVPTCICALCIQETALLHRGKYMYTCNVFVHYVFGKQNMSAITALLHWGMYIHVFVHYVFRKQNMSAIISNRPFALQKVLTCIGALSWLCIQETEYVSHNSSFCSAKISACICALCIQETEHVSNNSPLCTAKSTYMSLGTTYLKIEIVTHNRPLSAFALQKAPICIILQTEHVTHNSLPISNGILLLQKVPTLVYYVSRR